jgi:hypothetical protein
MPVVLPPGPVDALDDAIGDGIDVQASDIENAARMLDLRLHILRVANQPEIEAAFAKH